MITHNLFKTYLAYNLAFVLSLGTWYYVSFVGGIIVSFACAVAIGLALSGREAERIRRAFLFGSVFLCLGLLFSGYVRHDLALVSRSQKQPTIHADTMVSTRTITVRQDVQQGGAVRYALVPFVQADGAVYWVHAPSVQAAVMDDHAFVPFPPARMEEVTRQLRENDLRDVRIDAYGDLSADAGRVQKEFLLLVACYALGSMILLYDEYVFLKKPPLA